MIGDGFHFLAVVLNLFGCQFHKRGQILGVEFSFSSFPICFLSLQINTCLELAHTEF